MAHFSPKWKISYTSVPKNACTSLKNMFYYIENKSNFVNLVRNGSVFHVHNFYGCKAFNPNELSDASSYWKFAVVRDPLQRLVSCYRNRVLHHHELDERFIAANFVKEGALPKPSLDVFVERLELYCRASRSIAHHTKPHVFFLGSDPHQYDRLFSIGELPLLVTELCDRTGMELNLTKEQNLGPQMSVADLSPNAIDKLRAFYKKDYDIFDFQGPLGN